MADIWTIGRVLAWATPYFSRYGIDSPRMTAELLLAHALDMERLDLFLKFDRPLDAGELAGFKTLLKRRINGEPVAYLVGTRGFWTFEVAVNPSVLIPRPETEVLVEAALERLPASGGESMCVADLGTGSGAIVMALATERPDLRYLAVDRSADALLTAGRNIRSLGLEASIDLLLSDWLTGLARKPFLDMIVSNPPYIPSPDIPSLQREVSDHEPHGALDGGADGLVCLRNLVRSAPDYLKPGGYLIMEMGWDQQAPMREVILASGSFDPPVFLKDLAGLDRVVAVRKKEVAETG